ncbi:hypothetical protein EDC01DRAFT_730535 [Geopyxis carbonaria]|nr:hypothetical protein EDC01DRAFT_730535 [Geopyxis carbonaria]
METTTTATESSCARFHELTSSCRRRIKKSVHTLDSKFIYGWIPLLNTIIFALEMAVVAQIVRRYDHYYDTRPVLTMMVTNSVLSAIADTVAQTVTSVRRRAAITSLNADLDDLSSSKKDIIIELDNMAEKLPHYGNDLIPHNVTPNGPAPFDFERLARFSAWGFIVAPFQFKWLQLLQKTFPMSAAAGSTLPALKRVAADQLAFAPVGLAAFFSYMTYAEGGDSAAVRKRLGQVYLPTLKANYMLWPAAQLLNFRLMPLQFQLPFASTLGIAWGTYLSLANSSSDP